MNFEKGLDSFNGSTISSGQLIHNGVVPSLSWKINGDRQWIWASSPIPLSKWLFTAFRYSQDGHTALYGGGVNAHEIWLFQRPALK